MLDEALTALRLGTGNPNATFRDGQWESILGLVQNRARVLLIRRTGWGKSIVYFVSACLLRRRGFGPTLIISPLLALMRNQLEAARGLGLRAGYIISDNVNEWPEVFGQIQANTLDVLLISPERLKNPIFLAQAGPAMFQRLGMLVVDEAHCVSDWGHDFRPDYRKISEFVRFLPPNIPVLATTATANQQVENDVQGQLGGNLTVSRGSLTRDSLWLDCLPDLTYAQRLAWLAAVLPQIQGSGIIYALTVRDAEFVAEWLRSRGLTVMAYYGSLDDSVRLEREQQLLRGEVKALVATSALGMGFDKPDLTFVIHFQCTQSIIHYYQQVGRAGRAVNPAFGILLSGPEDHEILGFFLRSSLPPQELVNEILSALESASAGLSQAALMAVVNRPNDRIGKTLEFLSLASPSPILKQGTVYFRTATPYEYPAQTVAALIQLRLEERQAMQTYRTGGQCLMQFLADRLGDLNTPACGRCCVCRQVHLWPSELGETLIAEAENVLLRQVIRLKPRKKWPSGGLPSYGFASNTNIKPKLQANEGRALSYFQIGTVGRRVRGEKYPTNRFSQQTIGEAAQLIRDWAPDPTPCWIVPMVSARRPNLVRDLARGLAQELGIPCVDALTLTRTPDEQKGMENMSFRAKNLDGSLTVAAFAGMEQPGLLVDDMYDTGTTLTVVTALLRQAGAGPIYPFTLAKASNKE